MPRHLLGRESLSINGARLADVPTLLVQAPAGYGKTTLLAQWRLELLARGVVVAWLTGQADDDETRLLQGLALGLRIGTGRPGFGAQVLERSDGAVPARQALLSLLSELVQSALNVVLILDDVDRMPAASQALLALLLRKQPSNLRVFIGARSNSNSNNNGLDLASLLNYGQAIRLKPAELRFKLTETFELIRARLGSGFEPDFAARLHAACEGWPLGLQLLLAALADGTEAHEVLAALEPCNGPGPAADLRQQLMALLFVDLTEADLHLLENIAVVDTLPPGLGESLGGVADASEQLARLARDTPLLHSQEAGDAMRLLPLAREHLRQRLHDQRPPAEVAALHRRAHQWLQQQGLLEAAAHHAWEAGDQGLALDLAEQSLYEALTQRGRQSVVSSWLQRLPDTELQGRPRLLLAAAWSQAISDDHLAAAASVERRLSWSDADEPALRCECALILSTAAAFADDPDRFVALVGPWQDAPPLQEDPVLLQIHANASAHCLVLQGEPALARIRLQQHPKLAAGSRYGSYWGELVQGLSYLGEGQVRQAQAQLQPALRRADAELGRRSAMACMLAALSAACAWEQGRAGEAQALLADRLDVLERSGLPDTLILAYRTLACIAGMEGAEHRSLELLGALDAVGQQRGLPRLRIASLAEQLRLHARRHRNETCKALIARMDALLASPDLAQGALWRAGVLITAELARGHACIAAREWRNAALHLEAAATAAQALRLGRFQIEAQALRAFALERCGERSAAALLRECVDLAAALGLKRALADAHPELGQVAEKIAAISTPVQAVKAAAAPPVSNPAPLQPISTMLLTPRERELLDLLARNLSNKEAALAMQVGKETIKWHVKNLFTKLDAGTRKQVVGRARILGLIPSLESRFE